MIDGAAEAVRLCNVANIPVLVVTNQSGVARGLFDAAAVERFHFALRDRLAAEGARIDDILYCPHHPDFGPDCECRKPAPGMLLTLAQRWSIDLSRAFLIGDKASDMAAAKAAGVLGLKFDGRDLPGLVKRGIAYGQRRAAIS